MDQRREERIPAAFPVLLEGSTGVTCDVSATGMFFETNAAFSVGQQIDFKVEFNAPNGKMLLNCRGNIIRMEQRADRIGVGIRIAESIMGMVGLDQSAVFHL